LQNTIPPQKRWNWPDKNDRGQNLFYEKSIACITFLITTNLIAQNDSLQSAVYNWSNLKAQKVENRETKKVLEGSTLDLANLEIHTSTLAPGTINHALSGHDDADELILVKEGNLQVTVNDTTKTLGPGSIIFIVAGDKQSIKNISSIRQLIMY
jgi:uncharacterized cupin superfamily protein